MECERKTNMSTKATLPLILELTQPIKISPLVGDMAEGFVPANTKYNPETQVSGTIEGDVQFYYSQTNTYYPPGSPDYPPGGIFFDGWDA